jgi:uncharacterized membrane protein YkvA (DUF1232 family)
MKAQTRLLQITREFRTQLSIHRAAIRHPRKPVLTRWLLLTAIAYAASPIDLIPDFIPILGHLDDLIVIRALVALAVRLTPENMLFECQNLNSNPQEVVPLADISAESPAVRLSRRNQPGRQPPVWIHELFLFLLPRKRIDF